jgi:hypothetical protein
MPRVDEKGGRGRQVAKSRLLVLIVGRRSDGMDRSRDQFFLGWCPPPPLQPGMVGSFPGMGCVVPHRLPLKGTNHIQNFGL